MTPQGAQWPLDWVAIFQRALTARRIRAARIAAGFRHMTDAAPSVATTPQSLHLWERGKKEPHISALRRLSRAYGVSAQWLCGLIA